LEEPAFTGLLGPPAASYWSLWWECRVSTKLGYFSTLLCTTATG
jgi:hypothetical protein